MTLSNRFIVICLSTFLLHACGGESTEVSRDGFDGENGGSIERIDPAFEALVPQGAKIEKLAGGFVFTEGPVWDQRGNRLYFSDLRSNAIHTWSDEEGLGTFLQPVFEGEAAHESVGSNGLTIDQQGRLLLMEHGNRLVSRLETNGSRTILAHSYGFSRLNSPNDSVWHSSGWLYFTDPSYGLPELESDPLRELDFNGIYKLYPETGELELLERNQSRPNGIALSLDERTLYVANSDGSDRVWYAYDVNDAGELSNQRVFFDVNDQDIAGAADGMKIDVNGNIFATGPGGVWVFDSEGKHLGNINPPELPANVAWGGDGSDLYMTARTGLYRISLTTQGVIL